MINPKDMDNVTENTDAIDPEILAELMDGRDPEEIEKEGDK